MENHESREAISRIEQAVDLRAKWIEEIPSEVKTLKEGIQNSYSS
ncbi:hypothetical protein [Orientia tsutsugamushi]|nr:hypothetical protein [Orientia tsutsugamushi]